MDNDAYKAALDFMEKGVGTYNNQAPPWYLDFGGAKYEVAVDGDRFSGTIGFGTQPRGAGFHFASAGDTWLRQHPGSEDGYDKALVAFAKKHSAQIERQIKEKLFDDGHRIKREAFGYNNSEADEYGPFKNVRLQVALGNRVQPAKWDRFLPVVAKFSADAERLATTSDAPLASMSDRELNAVLEEIIGPEGIWADGEISRSQMPRRMQQLRQQYRSMSPRQQQQVMKQFQQQGGRLASELAARVADLTLKAHPEYGTTRMSDGYAMRYPSILIRTQPDYGESTANLPRGDALMRQASTNTECDFYKATDGKWYMDLEDYNEDYDTGEQIEGDMNSYGPFPSFDAAEKFLERNFSNPGGYSEDDSGRRKPPRKPVSPARFRRWSSANRVALRALEARNPPFHEAAKADEAMGEAYWSLVNLKMGFDSWEEIPPSAQPLYDAIGKAMSAVTEVRKSTYQIRMMVQRKRYGASSSRVAARHLQADSGWEIAKLGFHLSNGGAAFKVVDNGKGPEIIASLTSFGEMDSQIRFETTPEGLRRLADMLHIAAGHEGFSTHWDSTQPGLIPMTDDLGTYKKDQMMRSMVESLGWWNDRDAEAEAEGGLSKDSNEYGAPMPPRIASQAERDERYNKNILEVRGILERISSLLQTHESKQAADTKDWGYAGDLDHVRLQLASIERFLTDDRG